MRADRAFCHIHRRNTSFALELRPGLSPRPGGGGKQNLADPAIQLLPDV